MTTTSQKTPLLSELANSDQLSVGALAYLCERTRNQYYNFVMEKFVEASEKKGLTKSKLARRIHKSPDRVSHILGAPGNWTLDTIAELLAGISTEELRPASVSLLGRPIQNIHQENLISIEEDTRPGTSGVAGLVSIKFETGSTYVATTASISHPNIWTS